MWNMRSPPFRYSITKKRWDCNREVEKLVSRLFYSRLSGRCKRGGRGRGVSLLGRELFARSSCTQCHRPPKPHLSLVPGDQSNQEMRARFHDQVANLDCIVVLTASQLCQQNFTKAGKEGDKVEVDEPCLTFPFLTLEGI